MTRKSKREIERGLESIRAARGDDLADPPDVVVTDGDRIVSATDGVGTDEIDVDEWPDATADFSDTQT